MKIFCCRHGQSVANAGAATLDPLSIELTELGRQQAEDLALQWAEAPSLILVSPAERARATALPTKRRFPSARVEEWPIQEFTYLAPARCVGTTADQRREWVEAYWALADPDRCDDEGAESFNEFLARVDNTIVRLDQVAGGSDHRTVLLFGHGQFINAMRWRRSRSGGGQEMPSFRDFDLKSPVPHCEPLELVPLPIHR
ncbi:histidine phosphatase family protein [Roseateles sp. P5_E1]